MAPTHQKGRDDAVRWGVIRSDLSNIVRQLPGLFRNDIAAILLVIANIVPVINLLVKGEPVGSILVIYWIQMMIIGFWNIIKLIVIGRWSALLSAPVFILMYLSIVNIFGLIAGGLLDDQMQGTEWHENFSLWNFWWPALMFFATHGLSFYTNFLGRREDETTPWDKQLGQPILRAMPMWIAALAGGFVGSFFNTAAIAVLCVLPVKLVLDLLGHFNEHGMLNVPDDPKEPIRLGR